jgi:1,4-dihydroxy-2-naphthoate octaprenyltransferase/chlorophyll synthase
MSPADAAFGTQPAARRWLFALKPKSWPKLLVATALGQAIGIAAQGRIDFGALALGLAFAACQLAFVVLLNDFGDLEVDRLRRRLFPEGAPKTIPDGVLDARSVLYAGAGAGALGLGFGVLAQEVLARPGLAVASVVCVAIFLSYTFPPARLNYRGGGEMLEMLGVGFALPLWNAYAQGGEPAPGGIVLLPGYALLCLASALASGLGDVESDRLGGKRTFAVLFGVEPVRQAVEGMVAGAMIVWAALPWLAPRWATVWMVLPAVAIMVFELRDVHRVANGPAFGTAHGLSRYKAALHGCMWRGTISLAANVAIVGLVRGGIGALA